MIKAIDQKVEMINVAEINQSGEFDPWGRIDQGEKIDHWSGTYQCCEKDQGDVIDQCGDIY